MDAFYVSVEMRRHTELRGQPVVVGGSGMRGVVAAANYEARRFGVFSAMSSSQARRLCPHAIFLPGDHHHYMDVSRQVMAIFEDFTPLVEPIALDEAFLDVSGSKHLFGGGPEVAKRIRQRIADDLELPCSVGVAASKFVAKLASKRAKPVLHGDRVEPGHGVLVIEPGRELDFLRPLPVSDLWGVGPATLAKLERIGVRTVADLANLDPTVLERIAGRANARHLHDLAWGRDSRAVVVERTAKSIGREETYARDLQDDAEIHAELVRLCDDVASRVRAGDRAARTFTVKVRWSTFETVTRSVTPESPLSTGPAMVQVLEPLLNSLERHSGIRLLGVSASGLCEPVEQLSLLDAIPSGQADTSADRERAWSPASAAVDAIRQRFGRSAINPASAVRPMARSSPWGPNADDGAGVESATDGTPDDRMPT
jgi:DNA polymerase-4